MPPSTSLLFQTCVLELYQLVSLSFGRLRAYEDEVPLVLWQDELGRLRIWAMEAQWWSLDVRLRETPFIRDQVLRSLHRLERALADMRDVLYNTTADEATSDADTDDDDDEDDDVDETELQTIYHSLRDTINCLNQITMVTLRPSSLASGKVVELSRYAPSAHTQSGTRTMVGNAAAAAIRLEPMMPEDEAHSRRPPPLIPDEGVPSTKRKVPKAYLREQTEDDSDKLFLCHVGIMHTLYFPSPSIGDGALKIKELRQRAMEVTQAADPDCIKLFYRGKELEDDSLPCRDAGLKSQSAIHCEVLEIRTQSDSQASGDQYEELSQFSKDETQTGPLDKGNNKDRMGNASLKRFALPSHHSKFSIPPQAPNLSAFKNANRQLFALGSYLHNSLAPIYNSFIRDPPADKEVRNSEYKKLEETILSQVILKADQIETGDDNGLQVARQVLIREAQKMLSKLDQAAKSASGGSN